MSAEEGDNKKLDIIEYLCSREGKVGGRGEKIFNDLET